MIRVQFSLFAHFLPLFCYFLPGFTAEEQRLPGLWLVESPPPERPPTEAGGEDYATLHLSTLSAINCREYSNIKTWDNINWVTRTRPRQTESRLHEIICWFLLPLLIFPRASRVSDKELEFCLFGWHSHQMTDDATFDLLDIIEFGISQASFRHIPAL